MRFLGTVVTCNLYGYNQAACLSNPLCEYDSDYYNHNLDVPCKECSGAGCVRNTTVCALLNSSACYEASYTGRCSYSYNNNGFVP